MRLEEAAKNSQAFCKGERVASRVAAFLTSVGRVGWMQVNEHLGSRATVSDFLFALLLDATD